MAFIKPFAEIGKEDAGIAGGKGASLGEMTQAGIPVPPGYVVLASTFEEFIDKTNLNVEISAVLDTVKHEEMNTVEQASEKIQALIMNAKMPEDIAEDVMKHFKELGAEFVAVRSSATAEDSASAAWAGQLDTYLNTTEDKVLEKVQECWASLFTPRAIFYRFEKGLHDTKISVAVVVQKMVASDASGIAFSVHPVTEDRNQLIIEASWGLGEAIVSGQVTPDSFVVTKEPREILDKGIATKERGMYRKAGGGNEWQDVPAEKKDIQTLTDEQVFALAETVMGIERHYGFPCDIEWAMEAGKIYITQSRPITTLSSTPPESFNEAPPADAAGAQNLVAEYSLAASTWTYKGFHAVLHTFFPVGQTGAAMRGFFGDSTKMIVFFVKDDYVHWYWNDEDLTRIREEFFERLKKDKNYLEGLKKEWEGKTGRLDEEMRRLDETDLATLSDEELAKRYDAFYAAYVDQFSYFMALGDAVSMHADRYLAPEFEKVLGKDFTENFPKLVTTRYLSFIEEESLEREKFHEVLKEKGALDKDALEAHAQRFFYIHNNYAKGVRLTAGDFEKMIREDVEKNIEPAADTRDTRLKEQKQLIEKYQLSPWNQTLLYIMDEFFKLQDTRKKYVLTANYYQFEFLREAERRTGMPFKLLQASVYPEFRSVLDKSIDTGLLASRQAASAALFPGNEYRIVDGAPADAALAYFLRSEGEGIELKGMVASSGKVTGRVKKVLKIHDMANMEKGDVLVSSMTRPEMVPAMKMACAIVTDEGGITSHAAIVSRELGIPCIIGTKKATQVLSDGDLVEVDADAGIVRILKDFNFAPHGLDAPALTYKGDKVSGITGTLYLSSPLVEVVKRCPEPMHFPFYALTWKDIAQGKADEWFDTPKTLEETKRIEDLIDRDGLGYFTSQRSVMIGRVDTFVEQSWTVMSNLSALSDEELKAAYRSYMDAYADVFGYGGSTFIYEGNVSEELSQSLRKRYENTADAVTRALRSGYESFMVASEKALGEIQAARPPERATLEAAYCRNFFMMTASFSDAPVISGEWIAQRIVGLEAPIPHALEDETEVELTPHEKNLVGLLKESEVIRDVRKKANLAGCYVMMRFLDELAARTSLPKEVAGKMFWTEFEQVLNEPERMRALLQERRAASAIFDGTSCHYVEYLAVAPAAALGAQDDSAVQGVPAAKGKATGPVRIVVGPEDFKKVMPGDILVSEMTRPDYLPIMNIATAFVTDEGGLTCHAAIVAREMKKPCIIGTKRATQVFKDGDMVEVDANNGIVRKI